MRVGCGRDARLARFVTALLVVVASIALMVPRGEVAFSQTSTPSITKLFYATDLQVLGMAEQELFHFTLSANTLSDTASLVAHIKMVGFLGNGDARGIDMRGYLGAAEVWDTDTVTSQAPNPALNIDWRSSVQTMLGPTPVWYNNVQAVLGGNYFGFGTEFYVNSGYGGSQWAGNGYLPKATIDWTFNQVVRVTVQGLGPNEGWEGYVIATLEGQ